MVIKLRQQEVRKLPIYIPNFLFFSPIGAAVIRKATKGEIKLSGKKLYKFGRIICKMKKRHKKWTLIEVDVAGETNIQIKM